MAQLGTLRETFTITETVTPAPTLLLGTVLARWIGRPAAAAETSTRPLTRSPVREVARVNNTFGEMRMALLRHPSQVYEALLEGALLGAILWVVFAWAGREGRRLPSGTYGGIFLVGYGVFRSFAELFRQPDAKFRGGDDPVGTVVGSLTMGQTLSAVMIAGGLALLLWTWRKGRPKPPEAAG